MKSIKRFFIITFSALAIFLVGVFTPQAAYGVSPVTIRGNLNKVIPGPKLVPLANQSVSVLCGSITKTAVTDANGLYTITFNEAGCSPFNPVSTKSNYNSSTITRQVSVSSEGRATIDLIF